MTHCECLCFPVGISFVGLFFYFTSKFTQERNMTVNIKRKDSEKEKQGKASLSQNRGAQEL